MYLVESRYLLCTKQFNFEERENMNSFLIAAVSHKIALLISQRSGHNVRLNSNLEQAGSILFNSF